MENCDIATKSFYSSDISEFIYQSCRSFFSKLCGIFKLAMWEQLSLNIPLGVNKNDAN
jgi:hypothetical protein